VKDRAPTSLNFPFDYTPDFLMTLLDKGYRDMNGIFIKDTNIAERQHCHLKRAKTELKRKNE